MTEALRKPCPSCGKPTLLLLGPDGRPPPVMKCLDCDHIDPLKSPDVEAWIRSKSLEPPTKEN